MNDLVTKAFIALGTGFVIFNLLLIPRDAVVATGILLGLTLLVGIGIWIKRGRG